MAYLVVLVVDNSPHNKGDVISWRPEKADLEGFGTKMLAHPWFRVIHCPDMTDEEANALTSPEPGDRKIDPTLPVRAFKLELPEIDKKSDTPEDMTIASSELTVLIQRKR